MTCFAIPPTANTSEKAFQINTRVILSIAKLYNDRLIVVLNKANDALLIIERASNRSSQEFYHQYACGELLRGP